MARVESGDRKILESLAEVELSRIQAFSSPPPSLSVRSLAICSTSSTETLVYAGTDSGVVFLFVLDPSQRQERTDRVELDTGEKISSPKWIRLGNSPVESLIAVSEIGRVIALAEGFLHLFNLYLSQPVQKLGFLKGVTCVARKLSFAEADLGTSGVEDTSKKLFDGRSRVSERGHPQIAVFASRKLILCEMRPAGGFNRQMNGSSRVYDFGEFAVSVFREIQNLENVLTIEWVDDSLIVGTANAYSLVSCVTGQSSTIFTLPESSGRPLLKAMRRRKEVLLMVDNVGILSDSFGRPVAGSLILGHVPEAMGQISIYVVVAKDGKLDLHHGRTGVRVQSVALQGETSKLAIADEDPGNTELLVCATSSKIFFFRQVSDEEQIKDLLRKKNIKAAISLMEELEAEGCLSKAMVSFVHAQVGFILLFDLHFEEAVNHFLQSETMQPSEIFPFIMRDPNRWSFLVPRNRYWGLHPPPIPLEEVVDNGLMAIQRGVFLRKAGVNIGTDGDFLSNPPSRAELLESSIRNIIRYLEASRDKDLTPQLKEGIDTLLMYLFRALDLTDDMEQLASSPNSCVVEELDSILEDSGHLRTLAFLYASKGMYSKSLDVWRVLSGKHLTNSWKDTTLRWDLQYGLASSSKMDAAKQASFLLEESSDKNIVLQHLGWVAEVDEELAVRVLTSEKRVNLLPAEVLATIDAKKVEVIQRYLQWLIEDQGVEDSHLHTLYALSLAKSTIETVGSHGAKQNNSNAVLPQELNISDPDSFKNSRSSVRERLQFFLDLSDLYEIEAVLDLIEGSELWLEKAILYRKLGHEALVLQILALKLEDSEAAEGYCAEIGRPDAYMQLLDMYLEPQNGKEPMFNAAVRLLHNHGESLDPLQVLEKLSPDMPLQLASDTLLRMLRARVHHYRQGQIVYNLSRAINIDTRLSRFEERSRHVQINDESQCDSCHTRLGTKLFAMYPDDSVVCYKCFRRNPEHISPVNGHNFQRDFVIKPGWLVKKS